MTRMVDSLIAELEHETAATRRLLERVPEGQLAWKPHPKSMSLGQLAQHVARIPGIVSGMLARDGMDFAAPRPEPPPLGSAAELLPALEESVRSAQRVFADLDDEKAKAIWRLTRGPRELFSAPRITVARSMLLNHWYHHRGQLTVYLRQLDVPLPATYGNSADENPFAAG